MSKTERELLPSPEVQATQIVASWRAVGDGNNDALLISYIRQAIEDNVRSSEAGSSLLPSDKQKAAEIVNHVLGELNANSNRSQREQAETLIAQALADERARSCAAGPQSAVLDFQAWAVQWCENNARKLSQTEYGIAMAAFYAAHPAEGPFSNTMGPVPATNEQVLEEKT